MGANIVARRNSSMRQTISSLILRVRRSRDFKETRVERPVELHLHLHLLLAGGLPCARLLSVSCVSSLEVQAIGWLQSVIT